MQAFIKVRKARRNPMRRLALAAPLFALAACSDTGAFDFDLRDNLGNAFDTTDAVMRVRTEERPRPDNRGIISYPGYQVAVARRGDTLRAVAERIGLNADELSRFNAMSADLPLRKDQIVALPRRVAEPSPATGATVTGPIRPAPAAAAPIAAAESIAVAPLDAPGAAPAQPGVRPAPRGDTPSLAQSGREPVRHQVKRGETAFSIARTYGIPVKALADWNGLTGELVIREGQFLLIPVAVDAPADTAATPVPGRGSVAPVPPSAAQPLPAEDATADRPKETPPSPALGESRTAATKATRLALPVSGPIIRAYAKGRNDGLDISASAGTEVVAAEAGTVAAITRDTDQIPILVLRHAGNLLTVYAGVDQIAVQKGQTVKRGQIIARVRAANPPMLHFEVREGFESVDPEPYVN